ncbi:hypothetical protein JTB14_031079 [Gonioctena quinquepunctata]|nr:hypothetical protein JTB14_031079 [Gonioctena quinquepunctata]
MPIPSFKLQDPNIQGLHLPYLVCLLQTAGYQLERVECVNPKHIPQKGVSVVLTCGYSGQRCVMRYPEEKDVCNCFVKGEDSGDYYLEAVSNGNIEERWMIENGSPQYCVPFISNDLKLLCRTVVNVLVTMMKDSFKQMNSTNQNANRTRSDSESAVDMSHSSCDASLLHIYLGGTSLDFVKLETLIWI